REQVGAAEDVEIAGGGALEVRDGGDDIAADDFGVVPVRFDESVGDDVFADGVHVVGDRARLGFVGPVGGEAFIGPAAEDQGFGVFELGDGEGLQLVAPDRFVMGEVPRFGAFEI